VIALVEHPAPRRPPPGPVATAREASRNSGAQAADRN
jgi:hypothetical protein